MVKIPLSVVAVSIIICRFLPMNVFGGDDSDIAFLCTLSKNSEKQTTEEAAFFFPRDEQSEFRMFAYLFIGCYQNFISSQQYNVCAFEPSCSHYGQQAVKKYGFISGLIVTADRLQRCNPYAATYGYPIDIHTNKLSDPVEDFSLKPKVVP
jgi:putative membrane protein insertion efficiency factor